jgi:hypothetical protein
MKHSLLFLALVAVAVLPAVVANHIPPSGFEPGIQTELRVEVIQGIEDITEAMLMYRMMGTPTFDAVRLEKTSPDGFWLSGFLPALKMSDAGYEYYFQFTLAGGMVETLPVNEPDTRPFLLLPSIKSGTESDGFILLSDEQSVSARDGYLLVVSWYALEGELREGSIHLYVNGRDVSNKALIHNNMLLYKNRNPRPGLTTAFIKATTNKGIEITSKTWTTLIKSTGNITSLPLNLRGSLNAGTNVYSIANDSDAVTFGSDRDDGWAVLDMYGDYQKLKLQTYAYLSTLQNSDVQNINRFRMGVLLPFWDTYVGDYSPNLTKLTMSNKNLRGIYTKLHSRFFGLTFAHGEMVRKVDGKEINDPVTKETSYQAGTFKQEALAARMQIGSENGFLIGWTTTRNRDIISSLDSKYVLNANATDTTQFAFPKDNIVQSMDMRIRIPQIDFTLGLEGAGSIYNSNTFGGPLNTDQIEEYLDMDEEDEFPFNPADFQDIFIINTNMQPLPMSDDFQSYPALLAWQGYLRSRILDNLLNVSYSRVGASFHALSAGYLQSDAEQWQFSDQYHYKQLLFLAGGYNHTRDNVSGGRLDTNIFRNFYVSGLLRLPLYPYLNLSYTDNRGKNELNDEIELSEPEMFIPYKRSSDLFSIAVGYEFTQIPYAPSTVEVGFRTGTTTNATSGTPASVGKLDTTYEYKTNNFSLDVVSRFAELPLRTRIGLSGSIQDETVNDNKNSSFSFLLRGDYRLIDKLLYPWTEYKLISLSGDQPKQNYNCITLGLDVHPFEFTSLSTSLGWRFYNNSDVQDADYTTTHWHLDIAQRF